MDRVRLLLNSFVATRRDQQALKMRKQRAFFKTPIDQLETRQLLATFSYNSGTGLLLIETNQNGETLSIVSTSNAGNYTISTSGSWSGSSTADVGNTGTDLFIRSSANIAEIRVTDNPSNSGSQFNFGSSTGNFVDHLSVNFSNASSGAITVANSATFVNGSNLSLTTTGDLVSVSGPISANGSGRISLTGRNVDVTGNISSAAGLISLRGAAVGSPASVCITGSNVNSTSGNIQIEADDVVINGTVNATTSGTVTLFSNLTNIDLGTDSSGNFGVTQAEINNITASSLVIGANNSGSITNTSNISWAGNLKLVSGVAISQSGGHLEVGGTGNFVSAGDIFLTDLANNFTTVAATGNTIYVNDVDALTLGDIKGTVDLVFTASDLNIQGTVNATIAGGVQLVPNAGIDIDLGTNTANKFSLTNAEINQVISNAMFIGNPFDSGNISITSNIVPLGSNDFSIASAGDISETAAGKLVIAGNFTATALGNVTLANATNQFSGLIGVVANAANIVSSGSSHLDSINTLADFKFTSAGGPITQTTSVISVVGNTSLTATGNAVTLNQPTNILTGNVSAAGSDITITNSDAIVMGTVNASGNLNVTALANNITQTSAGVVVSGTSSFTATGNAITLAQSTNNFVGAIAATGAEISLADTDDIALGAITSSGNLTVASTSGSITQNASGLVVAGYSQFTATGHSVVLNQPTNNFVGNISGTAATIQIRNGNATVLGGISATDLTVNSTGGNITQVAGTGLSVTGLANLTAAGSSILATEPTNNFQNLSASGYNLTLAESNNLTLVNISIGNTVNITSADQVTVSGTFQATSTQLNAGTLNANSLLQTGLTINSGTANLASAANVTGVTILNGGNLTSEGRLSGTFIQNNGTANFQTGGIISGLATLASGNLTSNAAFNGGLTVTGGTLYTLHNGTTTTNLNFGSSSVWHASGSSLTDFGQITANGITTIASGANLTLGLPILICGQSVTVLNNTGSGAVSGTFSGLAQGAFFTQSGMPLAITYSGGAGSNDIIVTDTPRLMVIVGGNNQTAQSGSLFGSNLTVQIMGGAANETPVIGANVLFQLPVQVTNCNIASGYFNSVNDLANLTANVVTDSNGNATIALRGGVNPGPFNIQPVMSDYRSLYTTFNLGVVGVAVQKQSVSRSYVRYLDLVLTDPTSIPDLTALNSNIVLQKVKSASYSGGANITAVNLTLTATNAVKSTVGWMFDFGPAGIGSGGADSTADDGVYQFANATSPGVGLPATYQFHRLLGDVNGDKLVDAADTALVNSLTASAAWRYNYANTSLSQGDLFYVARCTWAGDANGDGRVNATDINITGRWRGRRVTY